MAITSLEVGKFDKTGFGFRANVKVESPFDNDQRESCRSCAKYGHGCSGPWGDFNNIVTLYFSEYADNAIEAFDTAECGLGVLWRSFVESAPRSFP